MLSGARMVQGGINIGTWFDMHADGSALRLLLCTLRVSKAY
jgi:hypothetical protein